MSGNAAGARIANRWTALIVQALAGGTKRYSELRREVGNVTHEMLAQTLRGLEQDGIVVRRVYPVVPPRVEYWLTPLGESLIGPLTAICTWVREHQGEVAAARARAVAAEPAPQ